MIGVVGKRNYMFRNTDKGQVCQSLKAHNVLGNDFNK